MGKRFVQVIVFFKISGGGRECKKGGFMPLPMVLVQNEQLEFEHVISIMITEIVLSHMKHAFLIPFPLPFLGFYPNTHGRSDSTKIHVR